MVRRLSSVRAFELALLGAAGAIAVLAIGSHALERDLLTSFPEPTPIKGNTSLALCLLILAVALDGHWPARALGAIAGLIGAVTLVQLVFSLDLGIDRLIFRELSPPAEGGHNPGRMAPNSAVALALLGTAFTLRGRAALMPALAAFLIALAGVAAYTDPDLAALSQIGNGLIMALPTAVVLACVSLAFVLRRERAWFTRDTVGGTLVRRAGLCALTFPLLGAAILLSGARHDVFSLAAGAWFLTIVSIFVGMVWVFLTARSLDQQQMRTTAALSVQAAIADNLSEGVCLRRESDGVILSVNPALELMFGYEQGTLTGTTQVLLADPDEQSMKQWLAQRRFWAAEAETVKADGQSFWCSVKGVRFQYPEHGEVRLALYHDVTERRAAQAEREALARERESALTELRRSNLELEQFAHVASHDLSEPLRVIGGFVGLLQRRYEGNLDADADRYIGATVSGVERMQELIDALLAYARVGSGDIQRSMVDTSEVADQAVQALGARIEETGGELRIGPLPTVSADAGLLGRVFQNLIANSLKFTNGEAPRVEVTAERGRREWVFRIADNGMGIDPEHSERIFGMFQRLHGRQMPGTGIGLPISRRIAEKHGGRMWVEPRTEGGSIFAFTVSDGDT